MHRRCFHLIHLDLPYNPNRLEQRNGRIDRYGQRHEPEIRYLYIPGTFEESLLLHLIAKYEKARVGSGCHAEYAGRDRRPGRRDTRTGRLSEDPGDLFQADATEIRSLDRAMADNSPQIVGELMREIDRAFDAFDLMAVNHGWYGMRAADSGMENLVQNEKQPLFATYADDLPDLSRLSLKPERPARRSVETQSGCRTNGCMDWMDYRESMPADKSYASHEIAIFGTMAREMASLFWGEPIRLCCERYAKVRVWAVRSRSDRETIALLS